MKKRIRNIKLIYSGELIGIAIVFLVLGILEIFKVFTISDRAQMIFKIVTLIGATWIFTDFVWVLVSPKRRARNSLMDKIMLLPVGLYLLVFDIVGLATVRPYEYYQVGMPLAFFYIACAYIFQGIYHFYHPIPMVQEMIDETIKEEEAKALAESTSHIVPEGGNDDDTTPGESSEDSSNEQ